MSTQRYGTGAQLLHWAHALLVLGLIGWGLYMSGLPKGEERSFAIGVHKSFGLIALALVLIRAGWRHTHPAPGDPRLSAGERQLVRAGHRLLYLLLVLTPLAGYLSASFTPYPMRLFGIAIPKAGWSDEQINAVFNLMHGWCAWTLTTVIVFHVAAVVLHSLRKRPVMRRMLPGTKPLD